MNPLLRQGFRFALVGVAATATHYAVLIALVEGAHAPPLLATTCGYALGISVSYALNRRYTFAASGGAGRFAKFAALYLAGAVLNGVLMSGFMKLGAHYLVAQIGATALVLIWNFLGARFLVFRD